jgi:soluble lytic murein transglycosylase-like protein
MVQVESNYNRYALSPKGAQGVMQLMPATARRFGVDNAFDARKNIEGGVRYLKYLQELYPHDLRRVLAAYNAGEGAVARYNGIPRYPETVNYIYQVGRRLGQNRAAGKNVNSVKRAGLDQKPPEHRPVEQFQDEEGRVYLRTR